MSRDPDPSAESSLDLIASRLVELVEEVGRVADELRELRELYHLRGPEGAILRESAPELLALLSALVEPESVGNSRLSILRAARELVARLKPLKPPAENG